MNYRIFRASERPDLYVSREYHESIFQRLGVWPAFVYGDPANRWRSAQIDRLFLEHQYVLADEDDSAVGVMTMVPVRVGRRTRLPAEGWSWALRAAVETGGRNADAICALSATIYPRAQGRGLGTALIRELLQIYARAPRFARLIAPLRPLWKSRHPHMSMGSYRSLRLPDGRHQDPWIRVHERLGGKLANVCPRSLVVRASAVEWHQWTGVDLRPASEVIVAGGLAPVLCDQTGMFGTYVEPNIWVIHELSAPEDATGAQIARNEPGEVELQ